MPAPAFYLWRKMTAFFLKKDAYLVTTPWWLRKLFPGCVWDFKTHEKTIYLSFDDGPHPTITLFVLEQLQLHNAKATFFCIGDNVRKYPETFKKIIEAHHAVGNHTMQHINGWKNADDKYLADINEAESFINSSLFRPPYGRIKRSQVKKLIAQKRKYKIIMWSVLAGDWDNTLSQEDCFKQVKNNIYPGCIVVLHDSQKAEERLRYLLPKLLEHFTKMGYNFKTINC